MGKIKKYNKSNSKKRNGNLLNNSLGIGFFVIPLVILIFSYFIIFSVMENGVYSYISPVFKKYEPLEKAEAKPLEDYFIDQDGIFYDEDRHHFINESAEYFYEKTGVRIFLYTACLAPDENGTVHYPTDEEAMETCRKTCESFKDEGISLVILFVSAPEGDDYFKTWTYATDEVRDNYGKKCEKILEQYISHNFKVVGEYDDLFIYSYRNAADRLMGGLTSPLSIIAENLRVFILSIVTIAVVFSSVIFYFKYGSKR